MELGAPAWLGAPNRVLGAVLAAFNAVGTFIILLLTLMTDAEVISRKLSDIPGLNDLAIALQGWWTNNPELTYRDASFAFGPIEGVLELSELAIVIIVFLQLGYATRAGKMVRSDGLTGLLEKRKPVAGHVMGIIFNILGICFFAAIIYGGWPILVQYYTEGLWAGTQGLFSVPTWPTRMIVLIGCTGVSLQFLVFAIQHFYAARWHMRQSPA